VKELMKALSDADKLLDQAEKILEEVQKIDVKKIEDSVVKGITRCEQLQKILDGKRHSLLLILVKLCLRIGATRFASNVSTDWKLDRHTIKGRADREGKAIEAGPSDFVKQVRCGKIYVSVYDDLVTAMITAIEKGVANDALNLSEESSALKGFFHRLSAVFNK
jgi:hypothetical protein